MLIINILQEKIHNFLTYKKSLLPYVIRNFFYNFLYPKNFYYYFKFFKFNDTIKKNGYTLLPDLNLSAYQIKSFLEEIRLQSAKEIPAKESTERLKIIYPESILINLPFIQDIASSFCITNLAKQYFGCDPKLAFVRCWATNNNSDDNSGELYYHMDHHGHRCLKLFFYLTDVFKGDGEHEILISFTDSNYSKIVNSIFNNERLKKDLLLKRVLKGSFLLKTELVHMSLKDKVLSIYGLAGTCFIGDTYTMHRGTPITSDKQRIILQLLYVPYVLRKDKRKDIIISNKTHLNPSFVQIANESYSFET